jgi:hypothetical protein
MNFYEITQIEIFMILYTNRIEIYFCRKYHDIIMLYMLHNIYISVKYTSNAIQKRFIFIINMDLDFVLGYFIIYFI